MKNYTPHEIVEALDRFIIGQRNAKRSVAIALRNRWRRQQVDGRLRDEITPKNIIMIGSTGVGKTEIARRLARLAQAPFLKVEATKYTEVGYVGKDVESMIRDLTEIGVNMVKAEEKERVKTKSEEISEERILDILMPRPKPTPNATARGPIREIPKGDITDSDFNSTREKLRNLLKAGKLDDKLIELQTHERQMPTVEIFSAAGIEEMGFNMKEAFGQMFPKKAKKRKVKVKEAIKLIAQEEAERLIDMEKVKEEARNRVEHSGIVFLDELDKVAGKSSASHGPDVSREGVQRDILPIVEGTTVTTKYGPIKSDHILFIAAGAFNVSKPSDLIPELQGRFPIRVELDKLSEDDFARILVEPDNALTKQYTAMMKTEEIKLDFKDDAIKEIAKMSAYVNDKTENIGARRLHTIMEKLLDEISFEGPLLSGQTINVNAKYVQDRLADLVKDEDLSKYIL